MMAGSVDFLKSEWLMGGRKEVMTCLCVILCYSQNFQEQSVVRWVVGGSGWLVVGVGEWLVVDVG